MDALEFRGVRKSFGAVRALRDVSFTVRAAEAHACVGENGAGKSTLLKILAGVVRPDAGSVILNGRPLRLGSALEALAAGIGTVYQERLFFPNLSVAANIFAGHEMTGRFGRLDDGVMRTRAAKLLERLHVPLAPDTLMTHVSHAHVQLVQVARALAFDCKVLILDEPTDALTDGEVKHLFDVVTALQSSGTTILFVSHRLPEVFRLCERITVLRDGEYVGTLERNDATVDDVVRAMVGREPPVRIALPPAAADVPPVLMVRDVVRPPRVNGISFDVRPGEIVALFGLVGSGRTELLETIFGLTRPIGGTIRIGTTTGPESVLAAIRAGIALVPEDRRHQGLFYNLDVRDNLSVAAAEVAGRLTIRVAEESARAGVHVSDLGIKTASLRATPDRLSGGNQQKVVVGKWLGVAPRVLLLDEPTKGIDIGAKYELHNVIRREAARGMACVMASSDLPEVLALATRVLVLRDGRIQGELSGDAANEEQVMRLAASRAQAAA